ncbi:MAG: hypothetical protein QNJ02_11345 [Desulfobacterales bacterium]|nr:hypothetical protein [Desulfobacterales bacterium]
MTIPEDNQVIPYIIAAANRITYVNDEWWLFAEENGAGRECYSLQLLGRSLWDFIAGEETRHLYDILIDKTRAEKKAIQVPIRCDSPECRRQIMMALKSIGDGHIEFLCRTVRVVSRAPVELLRQGAERSDHPHLQLLQEDRGGGRRMDRYRTGHRTDGTVQ